MPNPTRMKGVRNSHMKDGETFWSVPSQVAPGPNSAATTKTETIRFQNRAKARKKKPRLPDFHFLTTVSDSGLSATTRFLGIGTGLRSARPCFSTCAENSKTALQPRHLARPVAMLTSSAGISWPQPLHLIARDMARTSAQQIVQFRDQRLEVARPARV